LGSRCVTAMATCDCAAAGSASHRHQEQPARGSPGGLPLSRDGESAHRRRRVGARLATAQLRRLKPPVRCRWRRAVGCGPGSVRETGGELVGWGGERRLAAGSRAHGRRAGRPAAARELSPVRRCLLGGPGRAVGRPAFSLASPGTATDHAVIRELLERNPHSRAPKDGRAHEWATVASDRQERLQRRPARRAARLRHPPPSWRSSVGDLADTSPERGRGGDVALPSPRRLLAAGIGRRARRRRAVPPGVNRFVAARGASATQAAG
jgi:hypothetical protein